jgi:hypothetical protein
VSPAVGGATGALAAQHARTGLPSLPAQVLKITPDEATALSAVAPLVGTTPRTVKRFVNTYRLLKARADDPAAFGRLQGSIGDHEVVAFLLAVVIGRPAIYQRLLPALTGAPDGQNLQLVVAALAPPADMDSWLARYPRYANAPAHRYAKWAMEVARFSFTPTNADVIRAATPAR